MALWTRSRNTAVTTATQEMGPFQPLLMRGPANR